MASPCIVLNIFTVMPEGSAEIYRLQHSLNRKTIVQET